jgi:RNA polymerase sigma-70 factor (ECF subfamily)
MNSPENALLKQWTESRDADAFAEIVQHHAAMVYNTCCRVLGNSAEAEDVTQECFVRLAQERGTVRSLSGWLHRMATHRAIDRIRSDSRRRRREEQFAESQPSSIEPTWDDIREMVDEAMAELPDKLHGPLVAHYFEGQTYEAIAASLGIPRATAAGRVRRGVEKVRKTLRKRGVPISVAGLAVVLAQAPAAALPTHLSAALAKIALAGTAGGAGAGTAVAAAGALTFGKIAGGVAVVAAAAITGIALWSGSRPESTSQDPSHFETAAVIEGNPSSAEDGEGVAALLVNAFKANSVQTANQPASLAEGAIAGIVLDEAGKPAAGADVSARSTPMSYEQVTSDSNGRFAIEGLEPSNHLYVQAAMRGTGTTGSRISAPAGPLTLTREGIRDLELMLHASGSIQGQLIDYAGKPVPGVNVSASPKSCDLNHPARSLTDVNGLFAIRDCAPFTYLLLAFPPGTDMVSHDTALTEITLEPGEQRTGLKLVYQPYVQLKGRVVDTSGNPVTGARVHEVYQGQMAETGSDGAFELTVFAGKGTSPTLGVQHADYDHVRHFVPEGNLKDIEIVLTPRLTLAGRVVNAKTRKPVTEFEIMHLGGRVSAVEFTRFFDRLEPVRDASGRFSMKMESPEYATVGVRADGYAPLVQGIDLLSQTGELVLGLLPGNHLEGTVRTANGDRVRGAKIYIGQFPYGYELADDEKVLVAKTNWMGSFSLDNAPSGENLIYAWHPDYPP